MGYSTQRIITNIGSNQRTLNAATATATLNWQPISYYFASITAYHYFDNSAQAGWHLDITYGLGYDDWHKNTFSLQYNNYAGNRFPWRDQEGAGEFINGALTLHYKIKW